MGGLSSSAAKDINREGHMRQVRVALTAKHNRFIFARPSCCARKCGDWACASLNSTLQPYLKVEHSPRCKKSMHQKKNCGRIRTVDSYIDWTNCELVEQIPGKVSGRPIVRGTRILADTIVQDAELGSPLEEIHENYPDLPVAAIQQ